MRLGRQASLWMACSFLVVSLRTGDHAEAVRRARAIKTRIECMTPELAPDLTPAEARKRVRALVDAEIEAMEMQALLRGGLKVLTPDETTKLGSEDAAELEALFAATFLAIGHTRLKANLKSRLAGFAPAPNQQLDAYLDAVRPHVAGPGVPPTSPTGLMVDRLAMSGLSEVLDRQRALIEGEPADLGPSASSAQLHLQQVPQSFSNDPFLGNGAKPFLTWWQEYVQAKQVESWRSETVGKAESTRRLFLELVGEKPLASVDKRAASVFRSDYLKLPSRHAHSKLFKSMRLRDLLGQLENSRWLERHKIDPAALKRKSVSSAENHMSFLTQYWEHISKHGIVSKDIINPFEGFGTPKKKRKAKAARKQWPPALLHKLYQSPLFRGCKSIHRRSDPGPVKFKDAKFRVTLMGPHLGARLNEVCSLKVSDVVWEGDIATFQIRETKNEASDRNPPIPPIALSLGFLEYRVWGRKQDEPLFPELVPQGTSDKRSISFSKWFGRYRKDIGVSEAYVDFHSFRANFITAVVNAGAHPVWIDEVTGHTNLERPSERDRYTKEVQAENKLKVVTAVDYGVDFSHLAYDGPRGVAADDAAGIISRAVVLAEREMKKAQTRKRRKEARAARAKGGGKKSGRMTSGETGLARA
jgi:integrase